MRRRARSASGSTWRRARSSRRASRCRRRLRPPWGASPASSSSTWGSRCRSPPRSSGRSRSAASSPQRQRGAAVRGRGGRGRRRHDAPGGARHARRVDGRPAVVGDGHGLPLAARRGDVRRRSRRWTRLAGPTGPRSSWPGSPRRRPCSSAPWEVTPPPRRPRRSRSACSGSTSWPRACGWAAWRSTFLLAPRATPDRGRRPGRRGPRAYSSLAGYALAVVLITGVLRATQEVGGVSKLFDLFRGSYGHDARHQGRGRPGVDRAGRVQPVPLDPADGRTAGTPPQGHGDRAGRCGGRLLADRRADRPGASAARDPSCPAARRASRSPAATSRRP